MADAKLTALDAITSVSTDDILYAVDDPLGTPVSKKITFDNLQKSITAIGILTTDIEIPVTKWIYFGPNATDGTWRMGEDGGHLVFQRRESGNWIEKGAVTI